MTVKEIEERTGMDRANIRFYEKEGLINPTRLDNGYRDYTQKDIDVLLRIKLLRSLHLSIEDIRALQTGEITLENALGSHLAVLQAEKAAVSAAEDVCRAMQTDRAVYSSLNAKKYLEQLENGKAENSNPFSLPEEDIYQPPKHPWRRFFARMTDLCLYRLPFDLLILLVFHINPTTQFGLILSVYSFFGSLLLMYLIEPILLYYFAATPGKLIFGLRVTMTHGVKLSYYAARRRTKVLLWRGLAWGIPVLSLVRLWGCRKLCIAGQEQDWDEYPLSRTYTIRDVKPWRGVAFAAVMIGMLFTYQWAVDVSALPPNRGDLTVAEYAENYNFICRYYYGQPAHYQLDINGKWNPKPGSVWDIDALEALEHRGFIRPTINNAGELNWSTQLFNVDQIYISPVYGGPPPLEYRVDRSGHIISISLSDETIYIRNAAYCDDYRLLALAYIQAQPEARPLTGTAWYIGHRLDHLYENTEFSWAGVTVHCNIEELEGDAYAYSFRMVKEP